MRMTPQRLLRFYPKIWRLRYGREFLALVETRPITPWVVVDVARAAGREWLARTVTGVVALSLAVSAAATAFALVLNAAFPPPSALSGWSSWPVYPFRPNLFGVWQGALVLGAAGRLGLVQLFDVRRVGRRERLVWLALLFLGAIGAQWTDLTAGWGPAGLHLSLPQMWAGDAVTVTNCMLALFAAGRAFPSFAETWHGPRRSIAQAARPLGLLGPASTTTTSGRVHDDR